MSRAEKRQARVQKAVERAVSPLRTEARDLVAAGRAEEAVDALLRALEDLATRLVSLEVGGTGRRTEKIDARRLAQALAQLPPDQVNDDAAESEATLHDAAVEDEVRALQEQAKAKRPRRRKGGRNRIPESVPREPERVRVPEEERSCPSCGSERVVVGLDASEVLEIVPLRFKVVRYEREKRACPKCPDAGLVVAPPGEKVWDRALAGPQLLGQLVTSKYEDHVPLARLRTMYRRMGVDIAVSTLAAWTARVALDLEPLWKALWTEVLASHVVQTDASGLKVLDRDHEDGIVAGTMWCYVGDRNRVVFRYTEDGKGASGPWTALAGRTGYVQADAASVFDALYDGREADAVEVGCWAHVRRRFVKLMEKDPRAAHAVELIGKMYRVEQLADLKELDAAQRRSLRQQQSRSVLTRLKAWLEKTVAGENPKSDLRAAARYPLNHWTALTRFLDDGVLALDNNLCELPIRSLAVGRRNWLFAGSHAGARNAAILYSLMRTCARNGVEPDVWLADVLRKLAAGWPESRVAELLPHHWREQAEQQAEPVEIR